MEGSESSLLEFIASERIRQHFPGVAAAIVVGQELTFEGVAGELFPTSIWKACSSLVAQQSKVCMHKYPFSLKQAHAILLQTLSLSVFPGSQNITHIWLSRRA